MNENYSNRMLKIIAICVVFVALTWGAMFSFVSFQIVKEWFVGNKKDEDLHKIHHKQNDDEQIQYGRIIELQEEMIEILQK